MVENRFPPYNRENGGRPNSTISPGEGVKQGVKKVSSAVLKINLAENKLGLFNRTPLSMYRKRSDAGRLTPSAVAIMAKTYSLSTSSEDSGYRCTYDLMRAEFGYAKQTVATAFSRLKENNLIERKERDQDGTLYQYIGEKAGRQFDNVPQYLYTAEICIDGEWRRMSDTEIRVLARIMTECSYIENGGGKFGGGVYYVSYKKLARKVGRSETIVKKAIYSLLRARLIYRPKQYKGVNRFKVSGYQVNKDVYEYKRHLKIKKQPKNKVSVQVSNLDYASERESYYSRLREADKARVERYTAILNADVEYKTNEKVRRELELACVKAEVYNPAELGELQRKLTMRETARKLIMSRLGVSDKDLEPAHHCKKCEDTGFDKETGRSCSCYPKGGGL